MIECALISLWCTGSYFSNR